MRVAIVQHAEFEGPGAVQDWVTRRDADVELVKAYQPGASYPDPSAVDLVVILGGPMNTDQVDDNPWLLEEKAFIRHLLDTDTPVLGICLGGQLLSEALGGSVGPNRFTEIGWFPIIPEANGEDVFALEGPTTVLQWHSQTFSLPPGAHRLASSQACANQAFQWGRRVIGLQFHPEFTEELLGDTVAHLQEDLVTDTYVQSAEQMSGVPPSNFETAHRLLFNILDYLTTIES